MGIKVDAVPGRLNQFITLICRPGIFYGQCSELCGVAHGFMPIVVHAIPYENFVNHIGVNKVSEILEEVSEISVESDARVICEVPHEQKLTLKDSPALRAFIKKLMKPQPGGINGDGEINPIDLFKDYLRDLHKFAPKPLDVTQD